jgi:UDP-glucose 4-epimerase
MIRVLLCGKDSYIGKAIIARMSGTFEVNELDLRNEKWRDFDFSKYDVVIHLAAIVHRSQVKDEELYSRVNTILAVDVAKTAISQGLRHFIFLSTMGVYGIDPSLRGGGRISIQSEYNPKNLYSISKLKAENGLINLRREYDFTLTIIRPPNVYGENCPGNYYRFMQFCAKYLIVFPLLRHNKFSMISIEHLCSEIEKTIANKVDAIICPQDVGEKSNAKRISIMAKEYGRVHCQSKFLGRLLYLVFIIYPFKQISNLFGDLYYDETLSKPIPFKEITFSSLIN